MHSRINEFHSVYKPLIIKLYTPIALFNIYKGCERRSFVKASSALTYLQIIYIEELFGNLVEIRSPN